MSNAMQESEMIAAVILGKLYEHGLNLIEIDSDQIAKEVEIEGETEEDVFDRAVTGVPSVMTFLESEAFIRVANASPRTYDPTPRKYVGVQLATRGLRVLDALPKSLDETVDRRSLGQHLVDGAKRGAAEMPGQIIRELIRLISMS